jgi:hypothetical protein
MASEIEIEGHRLPARASLLAAIEEAWRRLAHASTWWTARERLAIAAEVRRAPGCRLCLARREAISPGSIAGIHDTDGLLPPDAVEAIHRVRTDAARITRSWVRRLIEGPLGEERYVELVSIVAIVTALDTFEHALGRPARLLPDPVEGPPSRRRPAGAVRDLAFVATLTPGRVAPGDIDPFPLHGDKNIHRALSLVPQEVLNFFDLDVELYLRDDQIRDFAHEHRAISHRQIELVAGRASALNRCHY